MSLIACSALVGALFGCDADEVSAPPPLLQRHVAAAPAQGGRSPTTSAGAVWPLSPRPRVVRPFDAPADPWGAGHRGVDLSGTGGQTVRAAQAGRVVFSGVVAGRGVVSVEHAEGRRTTYEPVEHRAPVGTQVFAGTRIGSLSVDGSHCAPAACLHWGLLVAPDDYRDPLTLLGGRRTIVLLPFD